MQCIHLDSTWNNITEDWDMKLASRLAKVPQRRQQHWALDPGSARSIDPGRPASDFVDYRMKVNPGGAAKPLPRWQRCRWAAAEGKTLPFDADVRRTNANGSGTEFTSSTPSLQRRREKRKRRMGELFLPHPSQLVQQCLLLLLILMPQAH